MKKYLWPLLLLSGFAHAEQTLLSKSASATIRSNDSTIDFRTGINIFIGNVKVDHLAFELSAEKLVEVRKKGDTQVVTATGTPVKFKQNLPFTEKISHGKAEKIIYNAETKELRMWNYVITDIEGTVMKGNTITYLLLANAET